jgi:hypothetical protein
MRNRVRPPPASYLERSRKLLDDGMERARPLVVRRRPGDEARPALADLAAELLVNAPLSNPRLDEEHCLTHHITRERVAPRALGHDRRVA